MTESFQLCTAFDNLILCGTKLTNSIVDFRTKKLSKFSNNLQVYDLLDSFVLYDVLSTNTDLWTIPAMMYDVILLCNALYNSL